MTGSAERESSTSASRKPLSHGARLSAEKAAKAARKASKRGQTPLVSAAWAQRMARVGEWIAAHRKVFWLVAGGCVAIAVAITAWTIYYSRQQTAAATLLWNAVEANKSRVEGSVTLDPTDDDSEVFATTKARASALGSKYKAVVAAYPSSTAGAWAALGEGNAQLELGQSARARQSYTKALNAAAEDAFLVWRAREGLAYTFEQEKKYNEAKAQYTTLAEHQGGIFRNVADYHLARLALAQGDRNRAKQLLRSLQDRLNKQATATTENPYSYVATQAELRLLEVDEKATRSSRTMGGGLGGGNLSPEQLQELIRRLGATKGSP